MTKSLGKAKLSPIRELMRSLLSMTIATQTKSLVRQHRTEGFFSLVHFFPYTKHCPKLAKFCQNNHTFSTDGDQFDSFASNEVKSLVDIGNFVKPHLASIRFLQGFTGNNL